MNLIQLLIAAFVTYLGLLLVWYILQIVAYWRIFTKAKEPGWKSIIPLYNTYIQYKISWNTKFFWVVAAGSVVAPLMIQSDSRLVIVIGLLFAMAAVASGLVCYHKMSKAFGHGIGFTLGLIFLNPIFMLILGFDGSEYQGPQ